MLSSDTVINLRLIGNAICVALNHGMTNSFILSCICKTNEKLKTAWYKINLYLDIAKWLRCF